jgi:hypothetical protein
VAREFFPSRQSISQASVFASYARAVAKRIMEMPQRGMQDREALVAEAVRFITANYEKPSKLAKITA